MKKSILSLLIFFLSFFSQNGTSSDLIGSKVRAIIPQVDRFIVSYLKKLKAPGCVVAIVGPERSLFFESLWS